MLPDLLLLHHLPPPDSRCPKIHPFLHLPSLSLPPPKPVLEVQPRHHVCLPDLGPASTHTVSLGYHTADALHSTREETGEEPGPPGANAAGDDWEVLPGTPGRGADGAVVAGGKRGKTSLTSLLKTCSSSTKRKTRDENASSPSTWRELCVSLSGHKG